MVLVSLDAGLEEAFLQADGIDYDLAGPLEALLELDRTTGPEKTYPDVRVVLIVDQISVPEPVRGHGHGARRIRELAAHLQFLAGTGVLLAWPSPRRRRAARPIHGADRDHAPGSHPGVDDGGWRGRSVMAETLAAVPLEDDAAVDRAGDDALTLLDTNDPTPVVLPSERAMIAQLVRAARARGDDLTGPGGLLKLLTKTVLETALDEEMNDHLGYDKHAVAGRDGGNSRNGTRTKTVLTDNVGPVTIQVPRDRDASFDPVIVTKRQRRLGDVDTVVLSLYAKGLTTGEISAHFAEVYGALLSRDRISVLTDRVIEEMTDWCARPLLPVYAAIFPMPRSAPRHWLQSTRST